MGFEPMREGITILSLASWLHTPNRKKMNKLYKMLNNIKNNYYTTIYSQNDFKVGNILKVDILKKEKKEQNIEGVIISKKYNETTKNIFVERIVDGVNINHLINLKSPLIEKIHILNIIKFKKAKLYYLKLKKKKLTN